MVRTVPDTQSVAAFIGNLTSTVAANSTRYASLANHGAVEGNHDIPIPFDGVLRNFYVESTLAPGAGETYTFNVRINGANSGIQVIIQDPNLNGNDLVNDIVVNQGDMYNIQIITSLNAAVAFHRWSLGIFKR